MPSREQLLAELKKILADKYQITLFGTLGFEKAYALVMPRKRAEALSIHSIADLAAHSGQMSIAGDYEFFSRPERVPVQKAYGLYFREQRQLLANFLYAAAASEDFDVIAAFTSDG